MPYTFGFPLSRGVDFFFLLCYNVRVLRGEKAYEKQEKEKRKMGQVAA
jgi:hypothetical protein